MGHETVRAAQVLIAGPPEMAVDVGDVPAPRDRWPGPTDPMPIQCGDGLPCLLGYVSKGKGSTS